MLLAGVLAGAGPASSASTTSPTTSASASAKPEDGATLVHRCGPQFSQVPVAGCAHEDLVRPGDARSDQQVRDAREVARRQQVLASRLEAERRRRDAPFVQQPAVIGHPRGAAAPASGGSAPHRRRQGHGRQAGTSGERASAPAKPFTLRLPARPATD